MKVRVADATVSDLDADILICQGAAVKAVR